MSSPRTIRTTLFVTAIAGTGIGLYLWYSRKAQQIRERQALLTTPGGYLRNIAQIQLQMMDQAGTDDRLPDSLRALTGPELQKVYEYFGWHPYWGTGSSIPPFTQLAPKKDLFGWYSEELDENELSEMREIWQKSGLTLTF